MEANDIPPIWSKVRSCFHKAEETYFNALSMPACDIDICIFQKFCSRASCGGTLVIRDAYGSTANNFIKDGFLEFLNKVYVVDAYSNY
jgi:hypothetical protein